MRKYPLVLLCTFFTFGNSLSAQLSPDKPDLHSETRVKTLLLPDHDRSERFNTTTGEQLPAGIVVVFDENQPDHIRPCTTAYDRNVAGVISNGPRSEIIYAPGNTEHGSPVALNGMVQVLAVGPIAVGDFLTTSRVPGHARKAKHRRKAHGTIIGRAITPLAKGKKGKVEMWVARH